jgi:hypothetical protein
MRIEVERQLDQQLVLTLDSAYEYTDADLDHWDAEGPGSTFRKYYSGKSSFRPRQFAAVRAAKQKPEV